MKKLMISALAAVACSAMFVSCETLAQIDDATGLGLRHTFESTTEMNATVIHCSAPKYYEASHVAGKGRGSVDVAAHYSQNIKVRTSDGTVYSGTHSYDTDETEKQVSTGDTGIAKIGNDSGKLKSFERSY